MITNFKIFENKRCDNERLMLANAIINFMKEVFPKTKCKLITQANIRQNENARKVFIIRIHDNTDFIIIREGVEYGKTENIYCSEVTDVNIIPEHSAVYFLSNIFEKYNFKSYMIRINNYDIKNIIKDLTKENYKEYLIKKDADKYNL
jgi:hypothetical protein